MSDRPLRLCEVCGQVDDHPRHVLAVNPERHSGAVSTEFLAGLPEGVPYETIAQALDDKVVIRHLDCCAAAGCLVCQGTETLTGGKRGAALVKAIEAGALADFDEPVITDNKELGLNG